MLPTEIVEGGYAGESLRAITKAKLRSGGGCRQKGGKDGGYILVAEDVPCRFD